VSNFEPPADDGDVPGEEPGDETAQVSAEEEGRRYPSTIGGAFYLVVLAITAIGIGIVTTGAWRVGVRCPRATPGCSPYDAAGGTASCSPASASR
jgi:hypothetical protein